MTTAIAKTRRYGDYTDAELREMPSAVLIEIIKNFMNEDNFIIMTDSYKMTHHLLYPEGLQEVYSYLEPRGGEMPFTVFFGLQYFIKRYLAGVRITPEKIDEAHKLSIEHFGFDIFDRTLWEHIWKKHGGKLPLEIKAIPEGTTVAIKNVLMTMRNTDPVCGALTNITETLLMKVWAPNTVGAYGRLTKELITRYHAMTSDAPAFLIDFMHHDFGYRGVSSEESARLLGAAALAAGFKGTDTLGAIKFIKDYYNTKEMPGFSVIASEHSVMCSYGGRKKEAEAYKRIIDRVKKKCANVKPASGVIILSLVSDTYNIYNVAYRILKDLEKEFIGWTNNHGIPLKIVLRPDSNPKWGTPLDVLFGFRVNDSDANHVELVNKMMADMLIEKKLAVSLLEKGIFGILFDQFGKTINSKGYAVLHPQIGVLQGDGVKYKVIEQIYERMLEEKIDIMNLVFGSGGKYLQAHDRDEQSNAIKATHVIIHGVGTSIEKKPITDAGKDSKHGYLKLVYVADTKNPKWMNYRTVSSDDAGYDKAVDVMKTVFLNGDITLEYTFEQVRENSAIDVGFNFQKGKKVFA